MHCTLKRYLHQTIDFVKISLKDKKQNKFGELTFYNLEEKDHKREGKIRTKLSLNRNLTYPSPLGFCSMKSPATPNRLIYQVSR